MYSLSIGTITNYFVIEKGFIGNSLDKLENETRLSH